MTLDEAKFALRYPFHPKAKPTLIEGLIGQDMMAARVKEANKFSRTSICQLRKLARHQNVEEVRCVIVGAWLTVEQVQATSGYSRSATSKYLRTLFDAGLATRRQSRKPGAAWNAFEWRAIDAQAITPQKG